MPQSTKVTNGEVIEQLCTLLSNRKPELTVFTENFRDLTFTDEKNKQKKLIQYILSKFEMSRHAGNEYRPHSITLEHVLPQSNGGEGNWYDW